MWFVGVALGKPTTTCSGIQQSISTVSCSISYPYVRYTVCFSYGAPSVVDSFSLLIGIVLYLFFFLLPWAENECPFLGSVLVGDLEGVYLFGI